MARRGPAGSGGAAWLTWVVTSGDAETVMAMAFTSGIEAWDKRWATAKGRADWLDLDPEKSWCQTARNRDPGSACKRDP